MPTKNAKSPSLSPQDFLDRLQRHPDLQVEFEALLQVVENSQGDVVKADQAEELVAQRLQLLGQQAIQSWANRKHQILQAESDSRKDRRRKEKKGFTGTPATAKSKS
jgi:hypothetical protein